MESRELPEYICAKDLEFKGNAAIRAQKNITANLIEAKGVLNLTLGFKTEEEAIQIESLTNTTTHILKAFSKHHPCPN